MDVLVNVVRLLFVCYVVEGNLGVFVRFLVRVFWLVFVIGGVFVFVVVGCV